MLSDSQNTHVGLDFQKWFLNQRGCFRVHNLNNQDQLLDYRCRLLSLSCTASDTWCVKGMDKCPNTSLPHLSCLSSIPTQEFASHFSTKLKYVFIKIVLPLLCKIYHVLDSDTQFCLYLCFKMFFSLSFFFFYIHCMVDNDGCRNWIFLVVLQPIAEREPDLLFPVLAHPKIWKVCLPFSAIWLVVFSICIAICKWASVLLSDAQLLLMKQVCLRWVANAGIITLFLLWVLHRPKHVPLIGISVLWLLWDAGAVKRNARQKWDRHLNSSL